jgi:serine/threonine-protein kinase
MAMRKEPARRYSSVEQFSEDVRRHLDGLPVIARKDTFSYRSSKFIARHTTAVAAGVFIVLVLIAGIIATASQARVARSQRDKARAEQSKSQRINAFLRSVLQYANPAWYSAGKGKGPETTVLNALHDAAKRVGSEFAEEPEVRADLHQTIGDTYRALGFFDEAEQHFQSSLEIRRELFGEQSIQVAASVFYLGAVQNAKGNYAEAERLCRDALAIQRLKPEEGNLLPFILQELTAILGFRGEPAAAEPLDREALEIFVRRYGDEDIRVAFAQHAIGRDYYDLGDLTKAETYVDEALRLIPEVSGADRLISLIDLGEIYAAKGEYERAKRLLGDVAGICLNDYRKTFSEEKTQYVLSSHTALIRALCLKGDIVEAKIESEFLARFLQQVKSREGTVVRALAAIGVGFSGAGEPNRAESYLQEALTRGGRFMVKDAWLLAEVKGALGECLMAQKRYAEAEALLVESYESFKINQVPQSFRIKEASGRLSKLYQTWHRPDQMM